MPVRGRVRPKLGRWKNSDTRRAAPSYAPAPDGAGAHGRQADAWTGVDPFARAGVDQRGRAGRISLSGLKRWSGHSNGWIGCPDHGWI